MKKLFVWNMVQDDRQIMIMSIAEDEDMAKQDILSGELCDKLYGETGARITKQVLGDATEITPIPEGRPLSFATIGSKE